MTALDRKRYIAVMSPITMTYKLAMSIGRDAAERQASWNGRKAWNEDDWNLMAQKVEECLRLIANENERG